MDPVEVTASQTSLCSDLRITAKLRRNPNPFLSLGKP